MERCGGATVRYQLRKRYERIRYGKTVRCDMTWYSTVRYIVVRFDGTIRDTLRGCHGIIRHDKKRYDTCTASRYGTERYVTVRRYVARYNTARRDTIWYGTVRLGYNTVRGPVRYTLRNDTGPVRYGDTIRVRNSYDTIRR